MLSKPFVSILVLLMILPGCGGGTSGSGGREYRGTIVTVSSASVKSTLVQGTPVVGATVRIEETGEASTTDELGRFSIQSRLSSKRVDLIVEIASAVSSFVLEDIPDETQVAELVINLDETSMIVSSDVTFDPPAVVPPVDAPSTIPETSTCSADSGNVCGADGKTYSSECAAQEANATVSHSGGCVDSGDGMEELFLLQI